MSDRSDTSPRGELPPASGGDGASALSPAKRRLLEQRLRGGLRPPAALGASSAHDASAAHGANPAKSANPAHAANAAIGAIGAIARRPGSGPAPLSSAQRRIWLAEHLAPGSPAYTEPIALRLAGPLRFAALRSALGEIVRRHEILRSRIEEVEGDLVQVPCPFTGLALPLADLAGLPSAAAEAERLAAAGARRALSLERMPLRVTLLRLDAADHLLLLDLHHGVFDAWTFENLFGELAQLYEARLAGRPSPLPAPALQYADFAVWETERLRSGALADQLAFWRRRLAGLAPALRLGPDRGRPAVQDLRGRRRALALPPELSQPLRSCARRRGMTLFCAVLAGVASLLELYSGERDIAVGTASAGRGRAELEPLLGFFANNLVLRVAADPARGYEELLAQAHERLLEALEHEEAPFDWLVAELRPQHEPGWHPLFQILLLVQPSPFRPRRLANLTATPREIANGSSKFDLSIHLYDDGDRLGGFIEYATGLFDEPAVERLSSHLSRLLAVGIAEPHRPLAEIPCLGEGERHQLIREWNDSAPEPAEECLHWLVEAQVRRTPEALAVTGRRRQAAGSGDEALSYRGLDRRADALAARLRAAGVGPETRVGLLVGRSAAMVVGFLAILKAGGACLALDPAYPRRRLQLLADDCGIGALVVEEPWRGLVAGSWAEVALGSIPPGSPPYSGFGLRDEGDEAGAVPGGGPAPAGADADGPSPRHLAVVIYTSGSTGKPKGVAIEHRSAAALVRWALGFFLPRQLERVLAATSLCFDLSLFELFATLAGGGTVAVVENALCAPDAPGVALVNTVPSAAAELLRAGSFPASARVVNLAGEPVPQALIEELFRHRPSITGIFDLYGPTETTVYSAWAPRRRGGRGSVWRPVSGTRIHLLDASLRPVPAGVVGEIAIGGSGLARGYLGRPDLTAERFVPDPLGREPGARLYRTGDLAWRRGDGTIELLGRRDQQIKLRGFRIELEEVEAALRQHSAVREAAAAIRPDGNGEPCLVAYLVAEPGTDTARMREELTGTLPAPMVPARFVLLPALPRTLNGKLDRKALPVPASPRQAGGGAGPRGVVADALAAIWAEVLGCGAVGPEAHFFELGGHSLLAMRMLSRLRRALGVDLPLGSVLARPTLGALVEQAELALRAGGAPLPRLVPDPDPDGGADAPLSPAQQRLWFLHLLEPESPAYHVAALVRLAGRLQVSALRRALGVLLHRHEMLRTVFVPLAGETVQHAAPWMPLALPELDLRALPAPAGAAERATAAVAAAPFDLRRGPPLRLLLLRLAADQSALVLAVHHIAFDEWSLEVFLRELAETYQAGSHGTAPSLPPLPLRYADFARWQRQLETSEAAYAQLAYWAGQLAGPRAALDLPCDRPRPPSLSARGSVVRRPLQEALGERLSALARQLDATLFMALLAAFKALLYRYTGESDLLVGTPITCRSLPGLEDLVGLFLNLIVVRSRVAGGRGFAALLSQVRKLSLEAYSHRDLPFERIVEKLAPERTLARSPLIEVCFVFADAPPDLRLPGLSLAVDEVHPGGAKFDLTFAVSRRGRRGGVLTLAAEYSSDLFDAVTIERLLGHFAVLLDSLTRAPEAPLGHLEILRPEERHQLCVEWPGSQTRTAASPCLHELFAATAARNPGAVAVVCGSRSLSYGELAFRAAQLADRLRRTGVGPEMPVGLYVERSLEMVVGILGILAAGGAYVPLDPSYPGDWLAFVLADAGLGVLLTQHDLLAALPARVASLRVLCLDRDEPGAMLETVARSAPLETVARSAPPLAKPENAAPLVKPRPALRRAIQQEARAGSPSPSPARSSPEHLAYVMYTSGSTGRPKGVMITHRNVTRLFATTAGALDFGASGASDVWTLFHSFAFDFSVWELWGALLHGGRLVVVPYWVSRDPERLHDLLRRQEVTVLGQTPSAFRHLALIDEERGGGGLALRLLVLGGEQLELADLRPWSGRHPPDQVRLVNIYGPTEATVHVTFDTLSATDLAGSRRSSIGLPVADLRVQILDGHGAPAPLGIPGEICVAGDALARGYAGRPGLSADRFRPDPLARAQQEAGGRTYHTGDLGRLRADGRIEFLGRIDHQVKVRGFRVELGEIESVLAGHPAVREAVVAAPRSAAGRTFLLAYLVPAASDEPSPALLRAWLTQRLPEHMVPSVFVALEALPRTPSGKIDRRALPEPERTHASDLAASPCLPRNAMEARMAGLWAEVLQLSEVGVEDGFFALGGDSILGIQLVYRCRAAGLDVSLRQLFEAQTVANLAAAMQVPGSGPQPVETTGKIPAGIAAAGAALPPPAPVPGSAPDAPRHLTALQASMLAHSLAAPASEALRVRYTASLVGDLDEELWLRSWAAMLDRHPVLRTGFLWHGLAGPLQFVVPAARLPVLACDWRHLAPPEQEARLAALKEQEPRRAFDLSNPPLMRLHLIRFADDRYQLMLTYHHLLLDGWSVRLLRHDLLTCYGALKRGLALEPWTGLAFHDYLAWLGSRGLLHATWSSPPPASPAATPTEAGTGERYAEQGLLLSQETTADLDGFARAHRLTLNTLAQGAWALLLSLVEGREEVLFGVALSGRPAELAGSESMIGMSLEVLPLTLRVPRRTAVLPWLREVQAAATELQHRVGAARGAEGGAPIDPVRFGTTLFFQNMPRYTRQARGGEDFEILDEWMLDRWHAPVVAVVEPSAELWLELSYQHSQADDAAMVRALHLWSRLFGLIASHAELSLADLLATPDLAAASMIVLPPSLRP